ncbi:MAG: extracellular solute-binding protein [Clostridiales bacterium]|nr:extracellular solute-binding protein [Clostridiales bacterium]
MDQFARKHKNILGIIIFIILTVILFGCGATPSSTTPIVEGVPDTSKYVKLAMVLAAPASEDTIMGYSDTVKELNLSLREKINANVEITFMPVGESDTEYLLAFDSKDSPDIIYGSAGGHPGYFSLIKQDILMPLDELLPVYAKGIWEGIDPDRWEDVKYQGKIYGIPFGSEEYWGNGFFYREDLLMKYEMEPIKSIENLETFMDILLEEEQDITPIAMNEDEAVGLYNMLVGLHENWIPAPGLPLDGLYLVAESQDDIKNIIHPAFSNEFLQFAEKTKEWANKGYWAEDVLLAGDEVVDGLETGKTVLAFGNPDRYADYINGIESPGNGVKKDLKYFCFENETKKVIKSSAAQNVFSINSESENAERALMALDYILRDKRFEEIMGYGFNGSVNPSTDGDDLEDLIGEYTKDAITDPFAKFELDLSSVKKEIEDTNRVNSQYGIPILLGQVEDPQDAVRRYRRELGDAGIQKIIETLGEQLRP